MQSMLTLSIKTIKKRTKQQQRQKKNIEMCCFFFLKTLRALKVACACVKTPVCVCGHTSTSVVFAGDVGHGRGSTGADRCAPSLHWQEECS